MANEIRNFLNSIPKFKSDWKLDFKEDSTLKVFATAVPGTPVLGQSAAGTKAARTYFVKTTYVTANGETLASPEATLAVSLNNVLTVASPAASPGATQYNVYIGTVSGSLNLQTPSINIGTGYTEPTSAIVTTPGTNVPTALSAGSAKTDFGTDFASAPVNTVAPAITGTTTVGQVLTCSTGTWTGAGITYTYRWKRSGSATILGTNSTYTLVSTDLANTLTCVVTAKNNEGTVSQVSNTTAAIA